MLVAGSTFVAPAQCQVHDPAPVHDPEVTDSSPRNIAQIIKQVRRHEGHYANLDLAFRIDYRQFKPALEERAYHLEKDPDTWRLRQFQVLLQGDQFRVEGATASLLPSLGAGGNRQKPDRWHSGSRTVQVYDGQTWRRFDESKHWAQDSPPDDKAAPQRSGLISTDGARLFNFARPHMFLMESGCPQIPLSVYLSGHEAVRAWPNVDFSAGSTLTIKYLGREKFRGYTCHKVLIDNTLANGTRHNGWELWLAEDRNFIPICNRGYTYRWSTVLPVADSTIEQWKEVQPGIWFPEKAHTSRYSSDSVKNELKQKVTWTSDVTVTRITLEPAVDKKVFREFEFPSETKVLVQEGGRTKRSFVQE